MKIVLIWQTFIMNRKRIQGMLSQKNNKYFRDKKSNHRRIKSTFCKHISLIYWQFKSLTQSSCQDEKKWFHFINFWESHSARNKRRSYWMDKIIKLSWKINQHLARSLIGGNWLEAPSITHSISLKDKRVVYENITKTTANTPSPLLDSFPWFYQQNNRCSFECDCVLYLMNVKLIFKGVSLLCLQHSISWSRAPTTA